MIYSELSFDDFVREFKEYGREDNFSRDGLEAIYNYVLEYAEETNTPYELDVIALCCEFTEYTLEEAISEFSDILEDGDTIDEILEILSHYAPALRTSSSNTIVGNF